MKPCYRCGKDASVGQNLGGTRVCLSCAPVEIKVAPPAPDTQRSLPAPPAPTFRLPSMFAPLQPARDFVPERFRGVDFDTYFYIEQLLNPAVDSFDVVGRIVPRLNLPAVQDALRVAYDRGLIEYDTFDMAIHEVAEWMKGIVP